MINQLARLVGYNSSMWSGCYADWNAASRACNDIPIESQRLAYERALLEVLEGRALYERDSLLKHEPVCCRPLLDVILSFYNQGIACPTVLDFGGGLGSVYFQHKRWFTADKPISWNVVERPEIAATGRRLVKDSRLSFFDSLDTAVQRPPDIVVANCILPMVPEPETLLASFAALSPRWFFIGRMPVANRGGHNLISRQIVPRFIYDSESPFWFFDESACVRMLSSNFQIVNQSISDCDDPVWVEGYRYQWHNYLLCKPKT